MSFDKAYSEKEFIDPKTGECVPFTISKCFSSDRDFFKVFRGFFSILNSLSSPISKSVLFYLLEHMDNKNCITISQDKLSEELGYCSKSVYSAFKNLKALNVLVMEVRGRYIVNPSFIYKGSGASRFNAILYYDALKHRNDSGDYVDDKII